jgi:multimeric flavodoxin WrbA
MSKIIGFCGSPRKGNTEFLMKTALESAEKNGHTTEYVFLHKTKIGFCTACNACKIAHSGCVQKDDMAVISEKLKAADVWILGTPVYWWGPTAQMKVFMDRWYGLPKDTFKNKKAILIVCMEDAEEKTASHTIGMFKSSFDYLGVELIDVVLAKGVWEAEDIRKNPQSIQQAKDLVLKM